MFRILYYNILYAFVVYSPSYPLRRMRTGRRVYNNIIRIGGARVRNTYVGEGKGGRLANNAPHRIP